MVGRAEAVRRDADGLLVQERQQFHASGFRDGVDVHRQVRASARGFGQRLGVPADQPDPGAGKLARRGERAGGSEPFGVVLNSGGDAKPGQDGAQLGGQFDGGGDRQGGPGQDAGGDGPDEAGKRLAFREADRDGQSTVAEDVAFRAQAGDVLRGAELFGPGAGVGGERALQRREFVGGQEALGRVLDPADAGVGGSSARGAGGGAGLADPFAEADEVVRAAGLGAGADGGFLPAAEGLALDDRAGDAAVDVEVAGLDGVQPDPQFLGC